MNLSEAFSKYLSDESIWEFTTRDALNWYQDQKVPGSKPANHSDLNFLIIRPLIFKKRIHRVFTGNYQVIDRSASLPNEPNEPIIEQTPIEPDDEELQKEKEFFDYLAGKIQSKRIP